jgi:hypothetical protein
LLAPALPAFCGVLDLKVRHDLARRVYDDHLMMIVCPVEARVVGKSLLRQAAAVEVTEFFGRDETLLI